jgi:hypothetical protein
MTTPAAPPAHLPPWTWPVLLAAYDRTPTLTDTERAVLARLDHWIQQHHCRNQPELRAPLERLTKPLHDALSHMGLPLMRRQTTINVLLQQMSRRETPLWAWTVADWSAVLSQIHVEYRQSGYAAAYLLCGVRDLTLIPLNVPTFARRIFGDERMHTLIGTLVAPLQTWGYVGRTQEFVSAISSMVLIVGRPELEALTLETLERMQRELLPLRYRWVAGAVSRALTTLGHLPAPLPARPTLDEDHLTRVHTEGVPAEWVEMCQRWFATSTLEWDTRRNTRSDVLRVGRWLAANYPAITHPRDWTRDVAAAFVAAVDQLQRGDWTLPEQRVTRRGEPARPESKSGFLYAIRTFFRDCQEWEWIPTRFNPVQCFQTSRTIRAGLGPDPRVIADDIWAKLVHAGLNLTTADLPRNLPKAPASHRYPLVMVRAIALVWLFAGLRNDEVRRLRVGCIRWHQGGEAASPPDAHEATGAVCLLDVPVNKTSSAYTKPVDRSVGEAITAWEAVRPAQPLARDRKTGELVTVLFSYRSHAIGTAYINGSLIPMLCAKAGVPLHDARGAITSHRARSTIASQLYNAREPMSLAELQAWLGHKHPNSTQHYTRISPTRLAQSYRDAGYFARNVRTISVLIDQEAVIRGEAAQGLPWKYYDLGHGYCTYDFFEQCEHRMACAQCAFYRPKDAFLELLEERRAHLLHMKQDIPLSELEVATVEGDLVATECICQAKS